MSPTAQRQWSARVAEWRASGLTSTEFCDGRDFTPGALRHYAHLVARQRASTASAAVRLVRVETREAVAASPAPAPAPAPAAVLTVEIGGARVAIPSGFDAATVRAVLEALAPSIARR